MSVYLQIDDTVGPIQLASNSGYGEFGDWVDSLDLDKYGELIHLYEHGWSQDVSDLIQQVSAAANGDAPKSSDVLDVVNTLAEFLDGEEDAVVVTITDGFGPGDGKDGDSQKSFHAKDAPASTNSIVVGGSPDDEFAPDLPDTPHFTNELRSVFDQQQKQILAVIDAEPEYRLVKMLGTGIVTKDDQHPGETDEEFNRRVAEELARTAPALDMTPWTVQLSDVAIPYLAAFSHEAIAATIAMLPQASIQPDLFKVVDRSLPATVKKQAMKFAQSTNDTTSKDLAEALEELRGELAEGLTAGEPRPLIRRRVMAVFENLKKDRADLIAITESSRARHDAQLATVTESKVATGKKWLASEDACSLCLGFAAQGVIPLDQDFAVTPYGPVKVAPAHPRCYCSVTWKLKDLSQAKDFNPNQPRNEDGTFGSGGGAGAATADSHGTSSSGGRLLNLVELPVKLEHAVTHAVKAGATAAAGYLQGIWSGGGSPADLEKAASGIGRAGAAVGHKVAIVAKLGAKAYFSAWVAGNKAVELVARAKDLAAKGLSESEVSRVKGICTGYDVLACKPLFLGLEHAGMPHLAAASLFVPVASVAYVLHASVTNPMAVAKAAAGVAKSFGGLFKKKPAKSADATDAQDAVGVLCDAAKAHAGDDFFFAVLPHAIEYSGNHGGDISDAVALAEAAIEKHPAPKGKAVVHAPAGSPDGGQFVSGGGGGGGSGGGDKTTPASMAEHVNDAYNGSIETAHSLAKTVDENYRSATDAITGIPSKFSDKYDEFTKANPDKSDASNASEAYAHAIDGIPDHVMSILPDSLEDDLTEQLLGDGEIDSAKGTQISRDAGENGLADAVIDDAWNNQEDIEKIEPAEDELKSHWSDTLAQHGALDTSSVSNSIGGDADAALAAHAIDSSIEKMPKAQAAHISKIRDELIDQLASNGEVSPEHFKRIRLRIIRKLSRISKSKS